MKNESLFQQMRLSASLQVEHLTKLRKQAEENADKSWKAWRSTENEDYHEKFHIECENERDYQKQIERWKCFVGEKWYMTEYLFSDAHAYEVVEVYSWDRMDVRQLKATEVPEARERRMASFVPGGFVGHFDNSLQEWTFESDEEAPVITVRKHKDGNFYRPNTRTCPFVPHSEPYKFYDFNF